MYAISVMPYLDGEKYVKIFTIDKMPKHKLEKHCIRINPPKLSPFTDDSKCIIAFKSIAYTNRVMRLEELTDLMHLLHEKHSGYKIDYTFSKLMLKNTDQHNKNIMFYITYNDPT
jgi:hypothetical protein